jgi:hypothetical protein
VEEFAAMGRKGKWFGAVKKVFSPEPKEKEEVTALGILLYGALCWISVLVCISL